jgi:maleylpyruvate isomerase
MFSSDHSEAVAYANAGLAAARRATDVLCEVVNEMDDAACQSPSRLPGWCRGHVISHLARNADGLVNLLTSARTGIERPMYASQSDRDADIEEGGRRLLRVQQEDLNAANGRFFQAAARLSAADWQVHVAARGGRMWQAAEVPWARLTEILVHLVDVDRGVGFSDVVGVAGAELPSLVDFVVTRYGGRTDVPGVRLAVALPEGVSREWEFGVGAQSVVRGDASAALAWLTGRGDGAGLDGVVPVLPAWM